MRLSCLRGASATTSPPHVQKLSELPAHEAHSVLAHTAAPLLTLVAALPLALRDKAVVARHTGGTTLALSAVACSNKRAAQAAFAALSQPLARELASVRNVDLSHNRLGPTVGGAALLVLVRLTELRSLKLAGNDLAGEGLHALMQCLPDAVSLEVQLPLPPDACAGGLCACLRAHITAARVLTACAPHGTVAVPATLAAR